LWSYPGYSAGSGWNVSWLRDDQFERMAALLPGKAGDPGRTAAEKRMAVEAVP
jgi:hypothetical protein